MDNDCGLGGQSSQDLLKNRVFLVLNGPFGDVILSFEFRTQIVITEIHKARKLSRST